ncbi:MAG: helix-turn-helix domain-containing protein [Halodesulfurarchaeum sp.]
MVSLDTGTDGGSPRVYECHHCETTLVSSQEPDEVVCCDEPMAQLDAEEGTLNTPDIETVLRDVFGLSHNAIVICIVVIERGPITTGEIADIVGVSTSTVTKVLGHLVEMGILERFERNLTSGGTVNVYDSVPIDDQQRIYRRGLYQWMSSAIEEINAFELERLKEQYRPTESKAAEPAEQAAIYWDGGTDPSPTD